MKVESTKVEIKDEIPNIANAVLAVVFPRKLVHSGSKGAYPSSFVWDCLNCNKWNIWQTKRLFGISKVCCQDCKSEFNLDKSKPMEEITLTKDMKSIID